MTLTLDKRIKDPTKIFDCFHTEERIKEYARKKIEQIEVIQKDLDELKKCEYFREPQDDLLELLARSNALIALGTAINLLQELSDFYGKVLESVETDK